MRIQYGNLTPFGLWLASWVPVFERVKLYDLQYGWRVWWNTRAQNCPTAFMKRRAFAGFLVRPDYWVFGRRVIFCGWRVSVWCGALHIVYFRPPRGGQAASK